MKLAGFIAALTLVGLPAAAVATPYKLTFAGQVNGFNIIGAGWDFSGSISFDDANTAFYTSPFPPDARYNAVTNFQVSTGALTIGGTPVSLPDDFISINNYATNFQNGSETIFDTFTVYATSSDGYRMQLTLEGLASLDALTSSNLPKSLDPTKFAIRYFGITDTHTNRYLSGSINALSLDAVPESSSWAMMVGGFGLIGGAMRRRRSALRFA